MSFPGIGAPGSREGPRPGEHRGTGVTISRMLAAVITCSDRAAAGIYPDRSGPLLLEALNGGKVRAAGLDVWLSEKDPNWALAQHPSVSCTPHVGAGTMEAQKRIGAELVDIIEETFS